MGAKYLGHKDITVPQSGTQRVVFNTEAVSRASFQLTPVTSSMDASFKIWSSNWTPDDVPGLTSLVGNKGNQMTGSAYQGYWSLETTGSAITPSTVLTPYMQHFADIGSRLLMLEVSSSLGGNLRVSMHGKTGD